MIKIRHSLLSDRMFLLGLFTLVVNDFVLKHLVGGLVTGKLSDIAGLFVFPFFWSAFFSAHTRKIYVCTIALFIVWKTPLSTRVIFEINNVFGTEFYRVVDYSDLLALVVVPLSYVYFQRQRERDNTESSSVRIAPMVIAVVSVLSFVATTLPRTDVAVNMPIGESYEVDHSRKEILTHRMKPARMTTDTLLPPATDSLFLLRFDSGGRTLVASVKILEHKPGITTMELVSVKSVVVFARFFGRIDKDDRKKINQLTRDDYRKFFESGVINLVRNRADNAIYYISQSDQSVSPAN
ncbi:MAG TPA: hypothetical protein VGD65_13370 [Chryseosolibacter sp.]